MVDRLDPIVFVPPPSSQPWSVPANRSTEAVVLRPDGREVTIGLPLFWHEPPWDRLGTDAADVIAIAAAELGLVVSVMRRDLAGPDERSNFHRVGANLESPDSNDSDDSPLVDLARDPLPRMVPYRPERYGLSGEDFDHATIVDVRLTINRDAAGRFAYSSRQIQRWEATPDGEPLAGGGWVPATAFPPDLESIEHLATKLDQLRLLAPTAAVFVTVGPFRLGHELPAILAARPDGVILRCGELNLDGLSLASLTRRASQTIANNQCNVPLWINPGPVTPDDAVKLIAMGAAAVAADRWCDEVIDQATNPAHASAASRLGYTSLTRSSQNQLMDWIADQLAPKIDRFTGLWNSMMRVPADQRVAALDPHWAKTLGIPLLSFAPPRK